MKRSYRKDYWQDQPCCCEVWSEKQTIMGAIRPIAKEYGLTLRVSHGYGSTGMEQQIGEYFAGVGKDVHVFYLGDHDPSGIDIQDDLQRRVETAAGRSFDMKRLAIHAADIEAFAVTAASDQGTRTCGLTLSQVACAGLTLPLWSWTHCRRRSCGSASRQPFSGFSIESAGTVPFRWKRLS